MMMGRKIANAEAAREAAVIIAAGGTGGHVFPAEALIEMLVARGLAPIVMTDRRAGIRAFAGAERHVLPGSGIAGRGLASGLRAGAELSGAIVAARRLLARLRPRVVVGFGGYPSVAPIVAAWTLVARPRVVLHEQNAVLGRANRLLARFADEIALGFTPTKGAPGRAVVTGNPVRAAVAALRAARYAPPEPGGKISLLVLGGSQGARALSDLVPAALGGLPMRGRFEVVQQCRPEDLARVEHAYADGGIEAELASFFADVPQRIAAAHLVIARAGASTLAELMVIGRPQLLLPLPGAIDDHQRANAAGVAASGAAIVLEERGLSVGTFGSAVGGLLDDPARLLRMAAAAAEAGRMHGGEKLADIVCSAALKDAECAR